MSKSDINKSITDQIESLNFIKTAFLYKSVIIKDYNNLNEIENKLSISKMGFFVYLISSIVCGGLLYIAGFAQVFEFSFANLSKSGLLIIVTFGTIAQAWRQNIVIERLKMIKFLLSLKVELEKE
ncbi:MAG: hypothetical protein WCK02_10515 [Bacteroidota bacterium]